ncbi:unnamed protein product, partial [Arabidopsis halleri]
PKPAGWPGPALKNSGLGLKNICPEKNRAFRAKPVGLKGF